MAATLSSESTTRTRSSVTCCKNAVSPLSSSDGDPDRDVPGDRVRCSREGDKDRSVDADFNFFPLACALLSRKVILCTMKSTTSLRGFDVMFFWPCRRPLTRARRPTRSLWMISSTDSSPSLRKRVLVSQGRASLCCTIIILVRQSMHVSTARRCVEEASLCLGGDFLPSVQSMRTQVLTCAWHSGRTCMHQCMYVCMHEGKTKLVVSGMLRN